MAKDKDDKEQKRHEGKGKGGADKGAAPKAQPQPLLPIPQARESHSVSSQARQADGWHGVLSFCTRTSQTFAALSPFPPS